MKKVVLISCLVCCVAFPAISSEISLEAFDQFILGSWEVEVDFRAGYSGVTIHPAQDVPQYLVFDDDKTGARIQPFLHVTGRDEKDRFSWSLRIVDPVEENQPYVAPYALLTQHYYGTEVRYVVVEFKDENTLYLAALNSDPSVREVENGPNRWWYAAVYRRVANEDMISGDY